MASAVATGAGCAAPPGPTGPRSVTRGGETLRPRGSGGGGRIAGGYSRAVPQRVGPPSAFTSLPVVAVVADVRRQELRLVLSVGEQGGCAFNGGGDVRL